ncbi:MAG: DUF2780 domain-containing protein [Bacteroidales bacterium]|nr:DUF2780 domain-containing protein [Bacteroidales bacterium]
MKKTITMLLIVFAMISTKQANANLLIDMLVSKLGVSEQQANAGTGILLNYLQSQVSEDEFSTVSDGVEDGADSYMRAAEESGAYKSSVSSFGKSTSSINAPGLLGNTSEAFKKLGMKSDLIPQFGDIIISYLKEKGKEQAMNIFASMLEN